MRGEEKDQDLFDLEELEEMENRADETCEEKEPERWTIISALNFVLQKAKNSGLAESLWTICRKPLDYLNEQLGLTDIQLLTLAIVTEVGDVVSWGAIGKFLKCSRLSVMSYSEEIEQLLEMRWLERRLTREMGTTISGFVLAPGLMRALRHNQTFVPERLNVNTVQEFMDKLQRHICKNEHQRSIFEEDERWMLQLFEANQHLPLCYKLKEAVVEAHDQSLMLLILADYAEWTGTENEGLHLQGFINGLEQVDEYNAMVMANELRNGIHVLFEQGFIKHKFEDGLANNECYVLTDWCKEELLMGYTPTMSKKPKSIASSQDVRSCSSIKPKSLFYNAAEQKQVERLTELLKEEHFKGVQERLEKEGFRKGFACLFYGAPGTGKTETVLQIARETGRNIMMVNIAGMRDKYVGESEKNIKAVFHRYRQFCKESEVMPILFFNEADALINKRVEKVEHSVDKMDNAMQNIILQELEDLEGILIATTNLTGNLDNAFERRFLFKIEFQKPEVEVKAKIWNSMMSGLSTDDAQLLARKYDFSGGQIENIARKRTIDYILSGEEPSISKIMDYCQSELLDKKAKNRPTIGFSA